MNLFQQGNFTLNSGKTSSLKIECDALTDDDWDTLAYMVSKKGYFTTAVGVPTGGMKFAKALEKYVTLKSDYVVLIVDDVLTTGGSMERMSEKVKEQYGQHVRICGVVVFARNVCPDWITPIFKMW